MDKQQDSRMPYTYADDYIRSIAGYTESGTKLSRSDASAIISAIAEVLGMTQENLARELALHYLKHQEEITTKSVTQFRAATGM